MGNQTTKQKPVISLMINQEDHLNLCSYPDCVFLKNRQRHVHKYKEIIVLNNDEKYCDKCSKKYIFSSNIEKFIHCDKCHSTYSSNKYHCAKCCKTSDKFSDLCHAECSKCPVIYDPLKNFHCKNCHENYELDNRHCPKCMINNIYIEKIKLLNKKDICSICQHDMNTNEALGFLPCDHFFHFFCLSSWFNKNKTCPICRQSPIKNTEL